MELNQLFWIEIRQQYCFLIEPVNGLEWKSLQSNQKNRSPPP